jgi:hypothetical protein
MRAYTVATVAVALEVGAKWIDNVLSHHVIPGVTQSRQGVARRLTGEAVSVLEITLRLTRGFGIPLRRSLDLAAGLVQGSIGNLPIDGCELRVDVSAIRGEVATRLSEAVEYAPVPRRGRPPSTKKKWGAG